MYWLLCAFACFAAFFALMAVCSAGAAAMAPALLRHTKIMPAARRAHLLLLWRVAPLVVPLVIALGLALPAFLRLEPSATHEHVGPGLAMMSTLGALALGLVAARLGRRVLAASRLLRRLTDESSLLNCAALPGRTFEVNDAGALVATIGIFRPKVFVSTSVVEALTVAELEAAVAHEAGHISAFDNAKRVVMRSLPAVVPFTRAAQRAWGAAAEISADEAAVRNGFSPLDLASALVKIGRLAQSQLSKTACASCLVDDDTSSLASRVQHLLGLTASHVALQRGGRWMLLAYSAAFALVAFCFSRPTVLVTAHELLEKLVR